MSTLKEVFGRKVGAIMRPRPLVCGASESCSGALEMLAAANASGIVVTDAEGVAIGILTERDVVRRVAFKAAPGMAVAEVMTAPVVTVAEGEYLYRAVALMRRMELRHLPVVDGAGRPKGMVDLDAALAETSTRFLRQVDRLTAEDTVQGLRRIKAAQADLARELLADSMPAVEVQTLITDINNDIMRRVVERQLGAMEADGWGEAPLPFDVIVMGSAGRGESFLAPDQDNGFILGDYPARAHSHVDRFFAELAGRMVADLDAIGFCLCSGWVMATNPTWRKQLSEWRAQVGSWVTKRHPAAFLNADIFFDFRPVRGAGALSGQLREAATAAVRGRDAFLKGLAESEGHHTIGLTWRNSLVTRGGGGPHRGEIDVKRDGLLPLVEAVRLMALREGVTEPSTPGRLDALAEAGVIGSDEQDYLKGAFAHITGLLLRRQIADAAAGSPPGNFISPKSLTRREKDMLVDGLRAAQELARRARADITGAIL